MQYDTCNHSDSFIHLIPIFYGFNHPEGQERKRGKYSQFKPEAVMEIGNVMAEYTYGPGFLELSNEMQYYQTQFPNLALIEKYGQVGTVYFLVNIENGEISNIY